MGAVTPHTQTTPPHTSDPQDGSGWTDKTQSGGGGGGKTPLVAKLLGTLLGMEGGGGGWGVEGVHVTVRVSPLVWQ